MGFPCRCDSASGDGRDQAASPPRLPRVTKALSTETEVAVGRHSRREGESLVSLGPVCALSRDPHSTAPNSVNHIFSGYYYGNFVPACAPLSVSFLFRRMQILVPLSRPIMEFFLFGSLLGVIHTLVVTLQP